MNPTPSTKTDSSRRGPATTWTKADPYASRIHRRIDLILLAATIIILFLVLRASAHGQTVTINSVAPRVTISGGGGGGGGVPLGRRKPPVVGDPQWNGTTDSKWNTAGNWSGTGNIPPGATDIATFNNAGNGHTIIDLSGTAVSILNIIFDTNSAAGYTIGTSSSQSFNLSNGGAIIINSGVTNSQTISAGILLSSTNSSTATLTNNSTGVILTVGSVTGQETNGGHSSTLTLSGSNNGVVNGTISGSGGGVNLVKSGAGTWTLSGTDTVATTTVSAGTLLVNGSLASSGVTVNNSGTLGGTGTINGTVSVSSGAAILGGTGATASGTLTVHNDLTLNSGSIIELALGASLAHSTLARTAGTWSFQTAQTFTFINLGATTGTYENIITGLASNPGTGSWTITNPGFIGSFSFDSSDGGIDVTLTAIPEPSTWIAGGLAFVALALSQRRKVRQLIVKVNPVIS